VGKAAPQQIYNTQFITDEQMEDYNSMTVEQIRDFLKSHNSYFKQPVLDVDNQNFDAAQVIWDAANNYGINPKVLLATLEKENNGVTTITRLPNDKMEFLMGCVSRNTARRQIECAAERFGTYLNDLSNRGSTFTGWRVNEPRMTEDGVLVTPANKAIAAQFTYTPYAGSQWGGKDWRWGGVYLFYDAWNRFGFASPAPPPTPPTPAPTPPAAPAAPLTVEYRGFSIVLPPSWTPQLGDWFAFRYRAGEGDTYGYESLTCEDFDSRGKAADWTVTARLMNPKPLDADRQLSATNYNPNPKYNDGVVSYQGQ
jgi:hypothetical protein